MPGDRIPLMPRHTLEVYADVRAFYAPGAQVRAWIGTRIGF